MDFEGGTMRLLKLFIIAMVLLTIQTSIKGVLDFSWGTPDLLMIFLITVSLLYGPVVGVWCGFALGVAHDVYSVNYLGAGALAMSLVGYIAGFAEERVVRLGFIAKVMLLTVALLLRDMVYSLICGFEAEVVGYLLVSQFLPQCLYTLILGSLWFYFFKPKSLQTPL